MLSYFLLIHVLGGQVEGDGALDVLPVDEISVEADGDVEADDEDHGRVEDAVPAKHVLGVPHLILDGENLKKEEK